MGKIYAGNGDEACRARSVRTFLRKYGGFFPQSQAYALPALGWQDLADAIQAMPDNTPGFDGIRKDDLPVLSPNCIVLLTQLLQSIERGAP